MSRTPDEILALLEQVRQDAGGPPVEKWNPPLSGDIDMRIDRDGRWFHEGTPIERPALVRLFASILHRDGDDYVLVTPVEKWRLRVDDLPFVATLVERVEHDGRPQLVFTTNIDRLVVADADHPLTVDDAGGEPAPRLRVKPGLDARIARNAFYQLVEWAREQDGELVIDSAGATFPLGRL